MQRKYSPYCWTVSLSLVGILSAVESIAAKETQSNKSDQHRTRDTTTTKSKLESQKQGKGQPFKELNRHAPGGPEAVPDVKGSNKSGGASAGTGSGTGTTGASGGSGTGGAGSGGN